MEFIFKFIHFSLYVLCFDAVDEVDDDADELFYRN